MPDRPSSARVYDALLGGNDNYEADRILAARLEELCPGMRRMCANNRLYLQHAALYAWAHLGISQFLDLGSGFPSAGSVLRSAQAADPGARVVAVDRDPVVAGYQALLAREAAPGAAVVQADIRDREKVLAEAAGLLDLGRPVCVVLGLVLHHMSLADAAECVAGYAAAAAPGSAVVITSARCEDPQAAARVCQAYPLAQRNFTRAEVEGLFAGLEILPPGVGPAAGGRPGWAKGRAPGALYAVGGIGIKR